MEMHPFYLVHVATHAIVALSNLSPTRSDHEARKNNKIAVSLLAFDALRVTSALLDCGDSDP